MRILVLEDDAMVAMLMEDLLRDLGHEVEGPVSSVDEALNRIDNATFDAAILDVHLKGADSYAVASKLKSKGVPFAFATGYNAADLDDEYVDQPILPKPFLRSDLKRLLQTALAPKS
ncbi:Response regulator receiver domain-containing protein [Arboricoccus pini]|uniref:Response regulator receiver domain-containing protein n=1 Tax=Arboricoccus pini TaxID=1963835 RepID=A0A212QCW6_9PROT|nr:response regulator [Arboricoccus pini]SNB57160.1 Response regulator receiver domain-containing protein [Arboricoccus pini]